MTSRPRVAPYLTVSPAAGAIAFYAAVFGAQQRALMPSLDGLRIAHCELSINGGSVMVSDAFPELGIDKTRPPLPGEAVTASVSLEFDEAKMVDDTVAQRPRFQALCSDLGLKGTILLSPEGINLFLAGTRSSIDQFLAFLRSDARFATIEVKEIGRAHV